MSFDEESARKIIEYLLEDDITYYKDFKNSEHYTEEFKEEKLAIDLYCKKGSAAEKYAKDNGFRLITENDGGYMVYASYPEDKPIDKPNNMPDDKPNDRPLDIIPTDSETTDSETTDSKTTSDENPMKGDANGDNEINVTDIAVTAAHIKGIKALTDVQKQAADVNGDEQVNVTDIAMIAAHIKGIKAIG